MWRRRRRPTDQETAEQMAALAEAFRVGTAAEGLDFGWEPAEVEKLDPLCDAFLRSHPPKSYQHSMIMSMGAYLGELIVRHTGGRWSYDEKLREAAFETPDGLRGYPHTKVAKRLNVGPEHNLHQFYVYAVRREVFRDTVEQIS